MTGHYCIYPTWECQLDCAYCSIRRSKVDRSVAPVDWQEWARALPRAVLAGSVVDIAGGEPLLYPGLVDLLHALGRAGLVWALTTNGKAVDAIERLCQERPTGAACVNVSDHAGNPEAHESVARLRAAGYRVNVHRVDHPAAGRHEPDAQTITYQGWREGTAVDGMRRYCDAGLRHWVADPRGDMWRCVVALETGQPPTGNVFRGEARPVSRLCEIGCTSCYTEDPASWLVKMEAV